MRRYYIVVGRDVGREEWFLAESRAGGHLFTHREAANRVRAFLTRAHGHEYQVLEVQSNEPIVRQPRARKRLSYTDMAAWGRDKNAVRRD